MRADDYARAATSLRAFLDAFNEMLSELEPISSGGFGSFPTWRPRQGSDARAAALRGKAAALAGPAAVAFNTAGIAIDYKPPGTWSRQAVNPALVWSTMFDDMPMLEPSLLNQVGFQALGLLEHKRPCHPPGGRRQRAGEGRRKLDQEHSRRQSGLGEGLHRSHRLVLHPRPAGSPGSRLGAANRTRRRSNFACGDRSGCRRCGYRRRPCVSAR